MEIPEKYLDDLQQRKITKRALARILGVSESYLTRITPPLPKGKVRAKRESASHLAAARHAHREKLAKRVIKGRLKIATAAWQANCSERTIYRYIQRLQNA